MYSSLIAKYTQVVLRIAAASSGRQYAHKYRDSHDHHWPASNYLLGRRCSGVAAYSRLLWVPRTEDSIIWRRDPGSRQLCSILACPGCQRMLGQPGTAAGRDYRRLGDISGNETESGEAGVRNFPWVMRASPWAEALYCKAVHSLLRSRSRMHSARRWKLVSHLE